MQELFDLIVNTDDVLLALVADNLIKAYVILFVIIFSETGFIFFPFLPGDALIFSAGVIAAATPMNIYVLILILIVAAIAGNFLNFVFGAFLGNRLEESRNFWGKKFLLKYLVRTRTFYDKYGGNAVIVGRFFPILRTYIPFLAGMTSMRFLSFAYYTIVGAIVWVLIFALPGYFVGEIPWVKENFGLIFIALAPILLTPVLYKLVKNKLKRMREKRNEEKRRAK